FVVTIDSPFPLRTYMRRGSRAPAYCVATGKAILAFLPPEEAPPLPEKLLSYAAGSLLTPEQIEAELQLTRERGYAINRAEWQDHINGVAAPVHAGESGSVVAAVGLSGPAERLNQAAIRRFAPKVKAAAAAIGKAIIS